LSARGATKPKIPSGGPSVKISLKLICAATIMTAVAVPAFAMDAMTKGETMMIMSDGKMASMPAAPMDAKAKAAMMKMFKLDTKCMVMMMGDDGKMYSMTTTDAKCTAMGKM
jgi:hypothetical protein